MIVNLFCIINFILFFVNKDGFNLRILFLKKDLLILGLRFGLFFINCKLKIMKYVKRECVYEKMIRIGNCEFWNSYELIF